MLQAIGIAVKNCTSALTIAAKPVTSEEAKAFGVMRLDEQDHLLDLQSKGLADVAATNEKLLVALDDQRNVLESLRRDSSRLADDVRGEVGMSRAIELARAGADREAVADATGLSLEEAEAIVTFHGRK